jgi:DNA (cytosine-5)-methyltransferase 1
MINVGSDCSGVGSFIQSLNRLGIKHKEQFACDLDYYARLTYLHNYGTPEDIELGNSKEHKYHADMVKSFVLGNRVSNKEKEYLSDANEFAKKFSFYFPFNMYQREIPSEPCDIYISSVPCQSFSLAGKRKGEDDNRGVLFYNSHEFIIKKNPRYFIFENVKGLLSDASGRTFNTWLEMLGGKSVNGNPVIFPREDAAPYHIYHKVLNAKHFGVPQNRERVFIIGIRDDQDNDFSFPKPFPLTKRLKDVLETEVDEKYYLSDKMIKGFVNHTERMKEKGNGFSFTPSTGEKIASAVTTRNGSRPDDNFIKVKSATKKGYETATEGDSINLSQPNIETRRGRVGKEVAQTLDTNCNQGVMVSKEVRTQDAKNQRKETGTNDFRGKEIEFRESDTMNCITSGLTNDHFIKTSNALTTVQKDNVVVYEGIAVHPLSKKLEFNGFKDGNSPALLATDYKAPKCIKYSNHKIRRLTPRECARLMSFPDTFTWTVSDSQIYKQMGNSIAVDVLVEIISKLKI